MHLIKKKLLLKTKKQSILSEEEIGFANREKNLLKDLKIKTKKSNLLETSE